MEATADKYSICLQSIDNLVDFRLYKLNLNG